MFKNPIPDFSSLSVEPFKKSSHIVKPLLHDVDQEIMKLHCMIQAIFSALPLSNQETIYQDFLKLLAQKNLHIVKP